MASTIPLLLWSASSLLGLSSMSNRHLHWNQTQRMSSLMSASMEAGITKWKTKGIALEIWRAACRMSSLAFRPNVGALAAASNKSSNVLCPLQGCLSPIQKRMTVGCYLCLEILISLRPTTVKLPSQASYRSLECTPPWTGMSAIRSRSEYSLEDLRRFLGLCCKMLMG